MIPDWVHSMTAVEERVLQGVPIPNPTHDAVQSTSAADDDDLLVSYIDEHSCIASSGLEQVHLSLIGFHVYVYAQEIAGYMTTSTIPIDSNPFEWWSINAHLYPCLAKAAAIALSGPPSSVASEQLFSSVSDVYSRPKRNRLSLSNTKKLIFLHKCLPIVNYKYDLVHAQENNEISDSDDND